MIEKIDKKILLYLRCIGLFYLVANDEAISPHMQHDSVYSFD